jgi:hypothetical protein
MVTSINKTGINKHNNSIAIRAGPHPASPKYDDVFIGYVTQDLIVVFGGGAPRSGAEGAE